MTDHSQSASGQTCPAELLADAAHRAEADTAAGLAAVDELLRTYPRDPRLHFLKGSLLAALNRFGEAVGPFVNAVNIDPHFALARFQLGLLQLSSGDPASAAATWSAFQNLDAQEPLRLFAEGLLSLARDDFADTEARLKAGIARNASAPALNRDMQLVLDQLAGASPPHEGEVLSSAQLLLQLSSRGTRH